MYRAHRRRGADIYMTMLMANLIRQIAQLEYKPPVTLAVIGGCFLTFYSEVLPWQLQALIPSVKNACLQPYMIFQNRQWRRLFWAAFLHADEYHLYYNMSSVLWKGVQLERRYGPGLFAALLVELLVLSHVLFVVMAWLAAYYVPEYTYLYLHNCAIGISAVLFALKVVLNHDSPTYSSIPFFGITLPTKYMAWAELLIASLLNPQASFLGHLAGITAGLLHVRILAPTLPALARRWRQLRLQARIRMQPGQARYAGTRETNNAARGVGSQMPGNGSSRQRPVQAVQAAGSVHQQGSTAAGVMQHGRRLDEAAAGANEVVVQSSSRPLSAEELRMRRLQRFG